MLNMNLQLFAAGDDMAITNNKITALNVAQVVTLMAADADTANLAQKFIYTPTGKDNRIAFVVEVADSHGTVAYEIAAGKGVFGTAKKSESCAQNTRKVIQIETGRYMQTGGTVEITATPASGKKLKTDHAFKIWVIELQ